MRVSRLAAVVLLAVCLVPAAQGASGRAELGLTYDVWELSADGAHVAINRYFAINCDGISIWDPIHGGNPTVNSTGFCEDSGDSTNVTLAGDRLLWVDAFAANTYTDGEVLTGTTDHDATVLYEFEAYHDPVEYGPTPDAFAGHGSLLVFAVSDITKSGSLRSARLYAVEGKRKRVIHSFTRPVPFASVADGQIAVSEYRGPISILSADGRVLRSFRTTITKLDNLVLADGQVVAFGQGRFELFDAASGRRLAGRPLAGSLADLVHGIAAVVRGPAVHLVRLTDGRDVVAARVTGKHPHDLVAQLEPDGLFYGWSTRDAKSGHVVFVPWDELRLPA